MFHICQEYTFHKVLLLVKIHSLGAFLRAVFSCFCAAKYQGCIKGKIPLQKQKTNVRKTVDANLRASFSRCLSVSFSEGGLMSCFATSLNSPLCFKLSEDSAQRNVHTSSATRKQTLSSWQIAPACVHMSGIRASHHCSPNSADQSNNAPTSSLIHQLSLFTSWPLGISEVYTRPEKRTRVICSPCSPAWLVRALESRPLCSPLSFFIHRPVDLNPGLPDSDTFLLPPCDGVFLWIKGSYSGWIV